VHLVVVSFHLLGAGVTCACGVITSCFFTAVLSSRVAITSICPVVVADPQQLPSLHQRDLGGRRFFICQKADVYS
jgi:hypothetical protein